MGVVVGHKCCSRRSSRSRRRAPLVLVLRLRRRAHARGGDLADADAEGVRRARASLGGGRVYVALLTDPTTGASRASFATTADLVLAEPHALIGFAGPRVIEADDQEKLPKDFQRAEVPAAEGADRPDRPRPELVDTLVQVFDGLLGAVPAGATGGFRTTAGRPRPRRARPRQGRRAVTSDGPRRRSARRRRGSGRRDRASRGAAAGRARRSSRSAVKAMPAAESSAHRFDAGVCAPP